MKTLIFVIISSVLTIDAYGRCIHKVTMLGKISSQTWYDAFQDCKRVADTKELLPLLKIDAKKFEYTGCTIHETKFPGGHGLHRNCDQIEGFALFGSSKKYCLDLLNSIQKRGKADCK